MDRQELIGLIIRARAAVVRPQDLSGDERLDLIEALGSAEDELRREDDEK